MIKINMWKLFPELFPADYKKDYFVYIDIPENEAEEFKASLTKETADVYIEDQREEIAYQRYLYRNKAHYSLDRGDGIENDAVNATADPFDEYIKNLDKEQLYEAIASLPKNQAKRIYDHFFLGFSYTKIANLGNVDESAVRRSIERGLINLKKYFKKIYKCPSEFG